MCICNDFHCASCHRLFAQPGCTVVNSNPKSKIQTHHKLWSKCFLIIMLQLQLLLLLTRVACIATCSCAFCGILPSPPPPIVPLPAQHPLWQLPDCYLSSASSAACALSGHYESCCCSREWAGRGGVAHTHAMRGSWSINRIMSCTVTAKLYNSIATPPWSSYQGGCLYARISIEANNNNNYNRRRSSK